jgi:hypothetical protein
MKKFAEWLTARPSRAFLVGASVSVLTLVALPLTAWLPAGVMVLALLAAGRVTAGAAGLGAALPIAWGFSQVFGLGGGLVLAGSVLVPAYLAGNLLERSRSLSFVFQAVTLVACALVLLVHMLLGDPTGVLMPLVDYVRPALEETARTLSEMGVERTPEEIGAATARVAWATAAWMVLLHTMLAMFLGLWAFGSVREPGLFGGQFRAMKLGRFVAWLAVAMLGVSLLSQWLTGTAWQPAEDVLFVLACAFLLQALAVVHALRDAQVIGPALVVLTYVAVVLLPMAVVGLGFADSWVRLRERLPRRPPPA